MKTHFTWSIENNDRCPTCKRKTILITAPGAWTPADYKNLPDYIEVDEEISGHFCMECRQLVSLSLNT